MEEEKVRRNKMKMQEKKPGSTRITDAFSNMSVKFGQHNSSSEALNGGWTERSSEVSNIVWLQSFEVNFSNFNSWLLYYTFYTFTLTYLVITIQYLVLYSSYDIYCMHTSYLYLIPHIYLYYGYIYTI